MRRRIWTVGRDDGKVVRIPLDGTALSSLNVASLGIAARAIHGPGGIMRPLQARPSTDFVRASRLGAGLTLLAALSLGCGKSDAPAADSTTALLPAPPESAATASPSSSTALAPVRGKLATITDSVLTITTAKGDTSVRVVPPLRVYAWKPSDLTQVTPSSFIGVTSVKQPDGSERATEIHVFPEELKGTGEGSRLMEQSAESGSRSTMTNGTVAGSRMTNGSVAGSRMTNGTVAGAKGDSTMTVTYQGGSQTITIPAGVTVTKIALTEEKLAPGANVVVLTSKGANGALTTSTAMLTPAPARK